MEQPAPSVRELTASCISKFEGLLAVQDKKRRASLETRLADFKLWADGVGALAKPGASLDSRLQGRANDLGLVNNILTMLASSLDYYASLAKTSASADGAILNLDSAIKNLALIGVAIRRTGKASRNRRADQTFNPDAHQDLREHLECLVFLRPTETGVADLDTPKLSDLQRRLIEANLRRRHKFLLAQKYSKVQQGAQTQSLTPTVPSSTNDSPVKEGAAVAGITQSVADLHLQNPAPNPHHKGKERAAPTISGFSRASTAEGSLQHGAATNKYAPGAAKTQITLIASDAEFPQAPSVPLGRTILKCPCCCQSLPVETFRDPQRWKQHVIEDLCPYTCIAENCPTPQLLFCTRNEWESHVKKTHLPRWQCPFCDEQDEDYPTMESMGSHFQTVHKQELAEHSLSSLLSWAAVQKMGVDSCPLCSSCGPEDSPELVDHVLRHAFEFALRALPWPRPIVHDLNVPPGNFNLPEDLERARDLERWITDAVHEGVGTPELALCDYDGADHSVPEPTNVSEYSDYFVAHSYFDDRSEDKSSRPQGDRSIASQQWTEQSEQSISSNDSTVRAVEQSMLFSHSTMQGEHGVADDDVPLSTASDEDPVPSFVLVPLNSAARKAVEEGRNHHLRLDYDERPRLLIDFSNPERQFYTLGCDDDTDIYLPNARSSKRSAWISGVHASFRLVEDTGAVLLYDHSDNHSVEPLHPAGHNPPLKFHKNSNPRSVLVARAINSHIAFGEYQWYEFKIQWQSDGLYRFPKTEPYVLGPRSSRSKRYVQGGNIGAGSSGVVWWALDATNGKMMAVKKFHTLSGKDLEFATRECANLFSADRDDSIKHEHILPILGYAGGGKGDIWGEIFMPLMDGNLQFLVENVDIPHNDALSDLVLRQMLLALECIASHDIIHRNIKPENILWEHDEAGGYRFRLSDFGLSGISKLNRTVAETEPFMAPEMFHRRKQTTKVDIWSLFALFVWTRDAEFRRTCHQLRASDVHAWLAHVSQLEQYRDIGGMADMNPTKRPSARRQLAILDGLDDPISPGEDEPGDRLTAAFSQLSDAGYQADTQPYYEPYIEPYNPSYPRPKPWKEETDNWYDVAPTDSPYPDSEQTVPSTDKGKGRAYWYTTPSLVAMLASDESLTT